MVHLCLEDDKKVKSRIKSLQLDKEAMNKYYNLDIKLNMQFYKSGIKPYQNDGVSIEEVSEEASFLTY